MPSLKPILIAEDEPDDAFLIQSAFENIGIRNPLQIVRDGKEAMQYLAGEGAFSDRNVFAFPALLLLDIKMPLKDGFDVLRWLSQHPELKRNLPIVVFSSTRLMEEVKSAYGLGVQAFFEKPLRFGDLMTQMRLLKERWLDQPSEP